MIICILAEKATKLLCENIAPVHTTFFGDFWKFGTDSSNENVLAIFF